MYVDISLAIHLGKRYTVLKRSGWGGGVPGMWLPLQATDLDSRARDSWTKSTGEEEICVAMT